MGNKNICFVSPQAYPTLAQTMHQSVGGAEVQQVLIAKELKKYQFNISFVAGDYGQKTIEEIDGMRIIESFKEFYGNRKLRFLPDMILLFRALRIPDADIYYLRSPIFLLGQVALFCKEYKRKLIFSASKDLDAQRDYIASLVFPVNHLASYGIMHADVIIAQSDHQKENFKKNFGRRSMVIKNGISLPSSPPKRSPSFILWVGRIIEWKRPELFLDLAKKIQDASFKMVAIPDRDTSYNERIRREADKIPNLEYKNFVPYEEIGQYFDETLLFVNTSSHEGFPNTFLQAWVRYVPSVSLEIDPDECICRNRLGFHSRTFEQMVKDVELLLEDENLREEMGINARRYVEREHDMTKIAQQYVNLIENL